MSDIELNLINNHFILIAGFDSCKIKTLMGKTFDELLNDSIKRYAENIPVYNFILELRKLYEEDKLKIEENEVVLSYEDIVLLPPEEREILCLPDLKQYAVKVNNKGIVGQDNFFFEYSILDAEEEIPAKVRGCFIFIGKKVYSLSKDLFELFNIIRIVNNLPNDPDKRIKEWEAINKIKNLSETLNITLSSLFNNEKVIIVSKMAYTIETDSYQNFKLKPILSGIDKEVQDLFLEQYQDFSTIQGSYLINKPLGNNVRLIIPPHVKENLQTVKDTPTIRRDKDKDLILQNPGGILPYADTVSLEDFSNRVVDFGLYQRLANYKNLSKVEWAFPKYYVVNSVSDEKITITISSKVELKDIIKDIGDAYLSQKTFFLYGDKIIPFTEYNLFVIKDLLPQIKEMVDETDTIKKIGKTILLEDINKESHSITLSKDLIKNLQAQIKNIRDYLKENNVNNYEPLLEIQENKFPLSLENIKQMKSVVEIHLLESPEDINKNYFQEYLLSKFCQLHEEIPKDLKREIQLKEHQKIGLAWLENSYNMKEIGRNGVLLADDMGLGKTLQILSFIFWLKDKQPNFYNQSNNKPVLIVAPVILLENWKSEYYKFFNDSLGAPYILHGNNILNIRKNGGGDFLGKEYYQITKDDSRPKSYLDINELKKYNIIITNYETLSNYEFSLAQIDWSVVILDEAQKIKNENTHQTQVACKLKSDFRIACTGTPIENSLMDLWTIFKFVQDDLLGPKRDFALEFNSETMTEEKYQVLQDKFFYNKPYAFILRRIKSATLKDLPNKSTKVYEINMTDSFRNLYDNLRDEMRRGGGVQTLTKMNMLHQHPSLLINKTELPLCNDCSKIDKLLEILKNIQQKREKALIFCVFVEMQNILKNIIEKEFNLDNIPIINGSSSNTTTRQNLINKFSTKNNSFDVMILSPRAAGVGLNIVAANHVIHYGRWWNPAIEKQATDRVYRIGQDKEVIVHYLLYADPRQEFLTFDQYLHKMLIDKVETAENFLISNNINMENAMLRSIQDDIINIK